MITTCPKCTGLYEAASEEQANKPTRLCPRCVSLGELIDCIDSLVLWKLKVDVTSGGQAADELLTLIERAEAAAEKARAL